MSTESVGYPQLDGILSAVSPDDIDSVYGRLREPGQSFGSMVDTYVQAGNPFGLEVLFAFQLEAHPDQFDPQQASEQLAAAHINYATKLAGFGEDEVIAETIIASNLIASRLRAGERPE